MASSLRVGGGFALAFLMSLSAGAQTIEVTSADPSSGAQGTVNLDVTILGKGFAQGAVARFLLKGTQDPGGITVKSTIFLGTKKLRANIDISAAAIVGGFDIEVTASGRTGKGIELFRVTAPPGNSGNPLVRSDFGDTAADGIRSDGVALPMTCEGADYASSVDSCDPGHRTSSYITVSENYFLATRKSDGPEATRALVLDFSSPANTGSSCPNLDVQIANDPDRFLAAVAPGPDPDPCVDVVVVRFYADHAFHPDAQYSSVLVLIDGPIAWSSESGMLWNAKYSLEFVNPLSVARQDANTVVLSTQPGLDQAQLFRVRKGKDELLGTYHMPFQVTLIRLNEFLP